MASTSSEINVNEELIKDAPISVATLDQNLNYLSHSNQWLTEHAIAKTNIIGNFFFDELPEIPLAFKTNLDNCLKGRVCENEGEKFILNNGKSIWLKWKINFWTKKNNTIGGLIVILENITASRNLNSLTLEAQEVSRTGGWELNLITQKTLWTKMVNVIHEMPLNFTPQTYDECFVHFKKGHFRNKIIAATEEAIKNGTPWDEEVLMITGKNNEVWIRTKGHAEFENGKCVRIYGICQDIDKNKRSQLAYHEAAEQLKLSVTASNVGTWEYNIENGHTIWDELCYNLHGVDPLDKSKSIYRLWKNAMHPGDTERVQNEVFLYYQGMGTGVIEYRVILPNSNIRFIKSTVTFVSDAKSSVQKAIGISQDVTNEKLAEKKLQEFANITGEQNNSLTNFAHMVSHDLRSHSTNLSVLTTLLLDEQDENEKKQILSMLQKATESLNSTVYNLNEVVQSNNAEISDKLQSVNLLDAICTVQNNISTLFKDKKAICEINVSSVHHVNAVPAYLDSIILNLFTNSLKYAAPSRSPIIKISSKDMHDKLEITFEDNGKGIDLTKYGKTIFGMNKTFHRNKDARGVGLYITKNQIEAMGGSISVSSTINVGTTFNISLNI